MTREEMNTKLTFFKDADKPIHVKLNTDRFYNGKISDIATNKDFFIIVDRKLGEVLVMFSEVDRIEPFTDKEVEQ